VTATDPLIDQALLDSVSHLAESVGKGRVRMLSRLAGGKNNQVYRVEIDDGASLVLKRYFSDARDRRDRLSAEWDFLTHAWSLGLRTVPEPLARHRTSGIGLYGFVEGRKLSAAELKPAHIEAAIDFVLAVNAPPRAQLAPGSEACFTLAEHVATVERRVARLATLDPGVPHAPEAEDFIAAQLRPAWDTVRSRLVADARAAGLPMERTLRPDECCLSPSDFGFHNALANDAGKLTFLDFEYAGRDDPAKLVSDFFCQPEIPVPLSYHAGFLARIVEGLDLNEAAAARCRVLLDAYQIKWTCIILNDFLPLGAARRAFADAGAWSARCADQLAKARAKLASLETDRT
jgi:hypothetical protein